MQKRMSQRRSAKFQFGTRRAGFEPLEERRLMAAGGLPGWQGDLSGVTERLLVGYRNDQPAAVQSVQLADEAALDRTIAALAADPNVRYAERDYRVHAAVIANDPYLGYDWGLNNNGQSGGIADADIDAPEAWDIATGSTRTSVAVIDSGIDYTHPDLYQNIWINQGEIPVAVRQLLVDIDGDALITFRDLSDSRNQGAGKITDLNGTGTIDGGDLLVGYRGDGLGAWADGVSNEGDSYVDDLVGWNFVANTNNPYDDNGHGTHVAGTIGAMGNNGAGVAGVLWNTQLAALKFLDATGGGYISSAIAALNYAVSKGIEVSNNSWGGGGYSSAMFEALNQARAAGHIFVAAAGNGGGDGIGDNNDLAPNYPASYNVNNVVAVAATDHNDRLSSFSNYGGTSVDLAAPGHDILSTVPGGYAYFSGTSMATPHVSGVVALVQSSHPDWSYAEVISQVLNNADRLATLAGKVSTGGRLNAYGALAAPAADTSAPYVVSATPNATGAKQVSSVRVTFSEAINPSTFTTADITGFSGPAGNVVATNVVAVGGSGNKEFDVTFATQSLAGTYRFNVGPDVRDAAGNRLDQDRDGAAGETLEDRYAVQFTINPVYTYSASPSAAIRDRYVTTSSITVNRDINIADLNVRLDVTHTYDADLYMYLVAPNGSYVPLVAHRGGSGDNFRGTVLDDEAASSIAYGAAPFSGSYQPEYALSAFDGMNARGTWQLRVEDWYWGYTGRLNSWSLSFEAGPSASARSLSGSSDAVKSTGGAAREAATSLKQVAEDSALSFAGSAIEQRDSGTPSGSQFVAQNVVSTLPQTAKAAAHAVASQASKSSAALRLSHSLEASEVNKQQRAASVHETLAALVHAEREHGRWTNVVDQLMESWAK